MSTHLLDHLLDHPIIAQRYFFPRQRPIKDPFVVEVEGAALHCYRRSPHPGAPTLLHFHGNGEVVSDWLRDFAPELCSAGLNVCLAEYRGYGGSTGTPALVSMLDDAVKIADALGVDPSTLYVYGRSVGSIFALHVAAQRPVAGLVIESGIADVLRRLTLRVEPGELGVTRAQLEHAAAQVLDHEAKLRAHAGPVLVMHARADILVPVDNARTLAAWAGERGRLVVFERGDHNSIHYFNGREILAELLAFTGVGG
ncbi:MAG: alpha/beta fold hydrolase [Myxococcota bacterium]